MKSIFAAVAVVLLLGTTAYGQCCGWPTTAYYPTPVYAYSPPVYAYPTPCYSCGMPVAYPYVAYSPVVPATVWYGPGVVVRRPFFPWRPYRVWIP